MGASVFIPDDVSLMCTGADPSFAWCEPSVAHIRWDYRPVVRRVVRWANNVAGGKEDKRQTLTKAEFVEVGTVGTVGTVKKYKASPSQPDSRSPTRRIGSE